MIAIASHIAQALLNKRPVVALESTIITHGMPYPHNAETALKVENEVITHGAIPATIGVINGKIIVGLSNDEIEFLAMQTSGNVVKAAAKDLSTVVAQQKNAGTTASATMRCASLANISVFATGGIGGVHRDVNTSFDISSDLIEFTQSPVAVISAGCKSILDIPRTLEHLETIGVPIIGYTTSTFPAFHSRSSNLVLPFYTDDLSVIANAFLLQKQFKRPHGLLVANPIPLEFEIPFAEVSEWVNAALIEAQKQKISGKQVTPFLLTEINKNSQGRALQANIALIKNNAKVAAQLAIAITKSSQAFLI